MTLSPGTRLGPYEIQEAIGAGGMGEVYRALDSRLGRTVAVKVLPDRLSSSQELRQRLEREARAVSSLSHPHICALFDIGHEEDVDFLVMEHLEGETLATRLERGPLPPEQLLPLAIQIADALEAAHRHGVVHRDLKPANVMITRDGAKLLDFGLAKADPGTGGEASQTELAASPTISQPLTAAGTILGTYQYMAPEQLEGREVDARSDIFALGCVLYEMVTGRRAFSGKSQASLIGSIMHETPAPVGSLQPLAPPALARVIEHCLAKDPDERWQTAHDVKLQLQWIQEGGSVVGVPAPVAARRKSRERLAWAVAAAGAIAALVLGAGFLARAPEPAEPIRFDIIPAPDLTAMGSPRISPDGRHVAFDATDSGGVPKLWIRSLDAAQAHPVAGTEGAGRPFWSPDSRFLAFFANGKLRKVPIAGGPPQTICDAPTGADGTWGAEGTILYDGQANDPLHAVDSGGGVPRALVTANDSPNVTAVGWPEFLPDGKRFLYIAFGNDPASNRLIVGSTEEGFEPVDLFAQTSRVQYAPPGHLLYVREGTLVAQPFDSDSLEVGGEPVPLAEDLGIDGVGLAHFSASMGGTLVFRAGDTGIRRLLWLDREGDVVGEVTPPGGYWETALSPDGKRLVLEISDERSSNVDLWIRDLEREVSTRFTFDEGADGSPLWSPDGRWIYYSGSQGDSRGIYRKDASGVGQPELVLAFEGNVLPHSFAPDGSHLAFSAQSEGSGWDLWVLPLDEGAEDGGDRKEAVPFVQTPFVEVRPSFSPDGRWIAYNSSESGRAEVYVQPFPGPGGKWQISTQGGSDPRWSGDGRELFYLSPETRVMRVEISTEPSFTAGLPEVLIDSRLHPSIQRSRYLVTPDASRFLVLSPLERESMLPTTVVVNWPETLRGR